MKLEFYWNKPKEQIAHDRTGGDKGRLFLANEAKRLMDPYVPATQSKMLSQNVITYVKGDVGIVEYRSPYAHYQYEGELYVSSITGSSWAKKGEYKVPAGKKLKYKDAPHPLATNHWDEAMMVARKHDLVKAYQKYLNGKER